jgi:Sec-independent protein translocase protein TatA
MGFGEVVLILVVAFIAVGPQKMVSLAREMGKGTRWLKKSYEEFKATATEELDINEENNASNSQWNKKKG